MDFRSLNKFNVIVNTASGNYLPLTETNTSLSFASVAYLIFVWFVHITYISATVIGMLRYLPMMEAIQTGGTVIVICAEVFWIAAYLIYKRKYLRTFIRRMNSILVDSDGLSRYIRETMEPHKIRLKIYSVVTASTWMIWEGLPLAKVLETDQFTYTDFKLATYFPGAPFTVNTFVFGNIFRAAGGGYLMLKKIGIDVYVNYVITLLTAEYRYLEDRTAAALREKDEIAVMRALKKCVIAQCNTMKSGAILVEMLSISIGVMYFNCIFRFCCMAFLSVTVTESYFNKCLHVVFSMALLMQVYLLCSCIQDLLEASTSVANEAFYEEWYEHNRPVRCMLHIIGMGNKMECRLNAFGLFDLTVPTLVTILKHSYSACLLLMRFS